MPEKGTIFLFGLDVFIRFHCSTVTDAFDSTVEQFQGT